MSGKTLPFTALAIFALLYSPLSAQITNGINDPGQPTMTKVENQNLPGNDYNFIELKPGETCQVCIDACLNDPNCKGYTYVRPGVQSPNGTCWFKSATPIPVDDKNCISGVKIFASDTKTPAKTTEKATSVAQDLAVAVALAVVQDIADKIAAKKAAKEPGVIDANKPAVTEPGMDNPYISKVENLDLIGSNIRYFDLKQGETCQACIEACLNDPNCIAYTFSKSGFEAPNGRCYLKSSVTEASVNYNYISGLKKYHTTNSKTEQPSSNSNNASTVQPEEKIQINEPDTIFIKK